MTTTGNGKHNNEGFTIGSVVLCKTCFNQDFEGEVFGFDPQSKVIILKCPSSSGNPKLYDCHFINLSYVSDIQIKKEASSVQNEIKNISFSRLNTRIQNKIEEKKSLVTALSAGISVEGQLLFMQIAKIFNEVKWKGSDIVIWKDVTISPPYGIADIRGNKDSQDYNFVKKLVEKHVNDQKQATIQTTNNSTVNQSSVMSSQPSSNSSSNSNLNASSSANNNNNNKNSQNSNTTSHSSVLIGSQQ